jgi:hypothetical protein
MAPALQAGIPRFGVILLHLRDLETFFQDDNGTYAFDEKIKSRRHLDIDRAVRNLRNGSSAAPAHGPGRRAARAIETLALMPA